MELYEREFLIYRIRAGCTICNLGGKKILVYAPNKHISYLAQEIYLDTYNVAKEREVLDKDEIYNLLLDLNMWSDQKEKELEEILPKHIEYWKVELYNAFFQSNKQKTIRQYLARAKEEYENLSSIRHSFDHIGCIGCASYAKNMFIVSQTAKTVDGQPVNWQEVDINNLMNCYYASSLSMETMRVLSRTSPWDTLWPILKSNGSAFESENLSNEQQSLLYWSIMYDRISESMDCPSDEVIADDDVLDGWLIVQKRKRDEERKKKNAEDHLPTGKSMNADEVYLIAETPADAKKINSLNDEVAKRTISQRFREIDQKGVVKEQDLSDVKRQQMILANQAYINKMRRG